MSATIRAAAQRGPGADGRLNVTPGDLHRKEYEGKTGTLLLFVVDASGSMAARRQMELVKGTVLGLLRSAYEQRDEIAVIAFRGLEAELLLPAHPQCRRASGARPASCPLACTSLAHGLVLAGEVVKQRLHAPHSGLPLLLVLLSDGRANVSLAGTSEHPWKQALQAALELADSQSDGGASARHPCRLCAAWPGRGTGQGTGRSGAAVGRFFPGKPDPQAAAPNGLKGGQMAGQGRGRGRLVIAGTQSGIGKTTIAVGLIDALRRRGLTVQPFKVGPDYIDPTYHTLAAGRACRNLDTWMLPAARVKSLFARAAGQADIAIVEGVMGLYDGYGYENESGSTAEVAKLLEAPVILVLDAGKMARSAGAIALGYQQYDKNVQLAGFIVNNAASANHGRGVATAVEMATGLPVVGWLPREKMLHIPERYLGLIPTAEPGRWSEFIATAGKVVARHLDLNHVLTVAQQAPPLSRHEVSQFAETDGHSNGDRPVIAVARDEAFHFTYEDNLDLLRIAGAEIVFFSPLRDEALPSRTAAIILSGGFPEIHAAQLSANRPMHNALHAAHEDGLPIYAE